MMSEKIGELAAALSKTQGAMKHAAKDNVNPHFKSRYADLAGVIDACREPLAANGLSVSQLPQFVDRGVLLTTLLMHSSGEWLSCELLVPVSKHDAQGVGSALTYARRYALSAMVGVAQDDDDGNAATAKPGIRNRLDDDRPARTEQHRVIPNGEPSPPTAEEEVGQTRKSATMPAAGSSKKSVTAKLLEFKRAADSCTTPKMMSATLESWETAFTKMPSRAEQIAKGYARARGAEIEGRDAGETDGAFAMQLNEMAKE